MDDQGDECSTNDVPPLTLKSMSISIPASTQMSVRSSTPTPTSTPTDIYMDTVSSASLGKTTLYEVAAVLDSVQLKRRFATRGLFEQESFERRRRENAKKMSAHM
jgi:hypothetical protein